MSKLFNMLKDPNNQLADILTKPLPIEFFPLVRTTRNYKLKRVVKVYM